MEADWVVRPEPESDAELAFEGALRPRSLAEFVGQRKVRGQLELLLRAAGDLRVTHVPYRGGGPLLQDLIAGNIDAGVVTFAAGASQSRGGQLVALAVTSEHRSKAFAEVPTASETIAPGFVQTTWQGLLAPKETPVAAIDRFHAALLAVLQDKAVIARLADLGFDPLGADDKAFAQLFDRTVDTFASIARERNIAAGD